MISSLSFNADTLGASDWDIALAQLGGHPLQSALWGQGRLNVDRIRETRWLAKQGNEVVWMARVEERGVPGLGRVAWIPQGPTARPDVDHEHLTELFRRKLREYGFILAVMKPWQAMPHDADVLPFPRGRDHPQTIWIDLQAGRARLWENLDSRVRYGVNRGMRTGIQPGCTDAQAEIDLFFRLCQNISQAKGFNLSATAPLMQWLIRHGRTGPVQARIFVAHHEGRLGAGAFILRCGPSIHYMWGGTDRELSKYRLGEAVQWAVIEWALDEGCRLYDLEGIDPVNNPGTYAFKKKMGGQEITLAPRSVWPLTLRGRILTRFL